MLHLTTSSFLTHTSSGMCQNERRTMFAPHTNTLLFEQRNKQFGSDF